MADPYKDAPWQQGDILRADELNAMQAGLSPIGTVIPWALPFAETGGSVYSNVAKFAPFHLPATGGVYANSAAPLLAGAIGHTFVDGEPDVGDDGDLISGAALLKHHGSGYDPGAIYRRDGDDGPAVLLLADAFCVPDFRGRTPMGTGLSHSDNPYDWQLGKRWGDYVVGSHSHRIHIVTAGDAYMTGWPGGGGSVTSLIKSQADLSSHATGAEDHRLAAHPLPQWYAQSPWDRQGMGANYQPFTVTNFLIFAGERISDPTPLTGTGGARSGEPVRLHSVTTASMIRKQLADPNLSDEDREMLEAQLNGDPWPSADPPDTRTATKTKTTRKRKS